MNICVYRAHHTQLLQLRAAELIPHVTLSVQCATVRRYTLKWHQILFITENEILGFPAFMDRAAEAHASGSDVHAHADDVCTAAFSSPLWSGKLWLTRYLRRCFSLLWKVTEKSSAWESKLHPWRCKSVDVNPAKPNTIKYGKQSSVNQIFFKPVLHPRSSFSRCRICIIKF